MDKAEVKRIVAFLNDVQEDIFTVLATFHYNPRDKKGAAITPKGRDYLNRQPK